jgi:hypothetical protein
VEAPSSEEHAAAAAAAQKGLYQCGTTGPVGEVLRV